MSACAAPETRDRPRHTENSAGIILAIGFVSTQPQNTLACDLEPFPTLSFLPSAPLCSRAVEVLSASKKVRAGIEGVIVSLHSQKTQAHKTVTSAVVQSVQEANSKKVC